MSLKPLAAAGIESLLSTFLYCSPALKTARLRLLGKVLRVGIKGFSTSLILVSSERQVDVLGEWAGDADYTIITYASVLPKLHDRQQPAVLIRSNELEVQGDIQVVRNFVALVDLAESDPAELLAPYTGDIAAKGINKTLHEGIRLLHHGIKRQQCYVAETITEEWHMVPGPLEVTWFAEGTATVECAVDTLTKRLGKLEAK